jgi:hypothetical protein
LIIKDGSGTGATAKVNAENRLDVESVTRSLTQHINELYEKHFSVTFEAIDPTGADDYFFYFKNTGTKNIHMTKFRFKSSVIGTVEIHHVTGTASAITAVTPANRFIGSSKTITADVGTSVDFTGLTSSAVLIRLTLDVADKDYVDDAPSHIIIPPGQAIACLWDTATGILAGTIDIYEDQGVI